MENVCEALKAIKPSKNINIVNKMNSFVVELTKMNNSRTWRNYSYYNCCCGIEFIHVAILSIYLVVPCVQTTSPDGTPVSVRKAVPSYDKNVVQ